MGILLAGLVSSWGLPLPAQTSQGAFDVDQDSRRPAPERVQNIPPPPPAAAQRETAGAAAWDSWPDASRVSSVPAREPVAPAQPEQAAQPVRAGVGAGAVMLPQRLPYQHGDLVPSGYRVEEKYSSGLLIGGGVVFGAAYAASLIASGSQQGAARSWLYVPVVGPFGSILHQQVQCEVPTSVETTPDQASQSVERCTARVVNTARAVTLLLVDGLLQVAGSSLFLVGLASKRRELVREQPVVVVPQVASGELGMQVLGRF